ncbi:Secretion protein HlyD [Flavobacterium sp. 9R]|uniref:efflux RND transporter periplasmic adaptor subunit n=1 Tax=Flavobacterium sp. 9R TaxID=2653143 RepID=UPI0012F02392|nr:efflux RND transporter periplasmic adaptor subunit [Flavobacterium sp. 9R]VXB90496.1 Secretion protein HlyD [Flavobacterium sp. 9R]
MRLKLILVLGCVFFLLINCSKKESQEIQPTISDITESVYASGVIKAKDQYIVYPTVSGILKKTKVAVGQKISKGQLLFELDSDKADLNTQNALLAYELSKKDSRYIQDKIAELELKVLAAKDKLILDESIYHRNQKALQYEGISQVDFDRVVQTYKSSKSNFEMAQKQLAQFKSQLQNDQSKNAINLKISQKSQSDFAVKSEFDGQLFDLPVKEGTLVTPQTPIATIGKSNTFILEFDVDENDMVRVVLGQNIVVTMDSYKGTVFDAVVSKIYPIMDERSRTFKIEAQFTKAPPKLYPNLTAEANIVIQTKKKAITIPKEYLIDGTYVLVNKDEKRKVKVGLSDYKKVEILEGLQANETLYKPN